MDDRDDLQNFINPSRPMPQHNSNQSIPYHKKSNYYVQQRRQYFRPYNYHRHWNTNDSSYSDWQNLQVTNPKLKDTKYEKTFKYCDKLADSSVHDRRANAEAKTFIPVKIKQEDICANKANEYKIDYNADNPVLTKRSWLREEFSVNRTTNSYGRVSGWDVQSDSGLESSPIQDIAVESDPRPCDEFDIKNTTTYTDFTLGNCQRFSNQNSEDGYDFSKNSDSLLEKKQLTPMVTKSLMSRIKIIQPFDNIQAQVDERFRTRNYEDYRATNLLLFMLVKNKIPLDAVDSESFQAFAKYLCPFYIIPDKMSITNLMLDKYEELASIFENGLSNVDNVTLTMDTWTDQRNIKRLSLSCHYILDYEYKSVDIGLVELSEYLTSDLLEKWIVDRIEQWNLSKEKVVAVVTDWTDNIVNAVKKYFGNEKHLPFLISMLNTISEKIFELDAVKSVTSKVRLIVAVLKSDESKYLELENHAKSWISMYKMLDLFKKSLEEIDRASKELRNFVQLMPNASEVKIVEELLQLLKPFIDVIGEMRTKSLMTCSKAIPTVRNLKKTIDALTDSADIRFKFKETLLSHFLRKFDRIEKVSLLAHPRYKKTDFSDKLMCIDTVAKITKHLQAIDDASNKSTQTTSPNRDPRTKSANDKCLDLEQSKEPDNYLNQPTIQANEDPINFWKNYPNKSLATLALKYSTVLISVSDEKISSNAQFTRMYERISLQQLRFLNSFPKKYWYSET